VRRAAVLVALRTFPEVLDKLRAHFDVDTNDEPRDLLRDELIARLQGKQGLFVTAVEPVDATLVAACPDLRVVSSMAVGYNNIDVAACKARGITVTNAPDVLTETTADFGFALMLAAARRITESEHFLRAGRWQRWAFDFFCGAEVHGSTLGILGMGRIGQAIARRGALGFGMKVVYHNRSRLAPELEAPLGARWVDKDALLRESDHLVLVVPYSKASHHAIGAAELALMKPTATLTNVARGGVVDDVALAKALADRRIAAAALDVFEGEPKVHPDLLAQNNVVLTPHIASATTGTRRKMAMLAADNLVAVLGGRPPLTPVA
jgi:glyoxylate/hydroxypyruvate/2-ketogluconate reductase